MAKQIFYSVRRRDFMYLQGIKPNEKYKAGSKAPTMGTPHISADYDRGDDSICRVLETEPPKEAPT